MNIGTLVALGLAGYVVLDYIKSKAVPPASGGGSGVNPNYPAPIVGTPIGATSTASNGSATGSEAGQIPSLVVPDVSAPFILPVPVTPIPIVPEPTPEAYGGIMSPDAGAVFTETQGALDYSNQGYLAAITPYMAAGDVVNFLNLYYTIYDPDRNPLLYEQLKNGAAKAVYDYYDQIVAAAPSGLSKDGIVQYYTMKMSPDQFESWAERVSLNNPVQTNSWFTATAPDLMQNLSNTVQTSGGAFTLQQLVDIFNGRSAARGWLPIVKINIDSSGMINYELSNSNSWSGTPEDFYSIIQNM
jgi:hypothetical protein